MRCAVVGINGSRFRFLAGLLIALGVPFAQANESPTPVDLELVLAVDSSWSVDNEEFALQMGGIASAFRDDELARAIEELGPSGIAVALVQWAGNDEQMVSVDWTVVRDRRSALRFAARVERSVRLIIGATAISSALDYAARMLATNGYEAVRKVIDVSGDGRSNEGSSPRWRSGALAKSGITINGLPILSDWPNLDRYYEEQVVAGPGSFLVPAANYQDFVQAIRAKLLREIRGQSVASQ